MIEAMRSLEQIDAELQAIAVQAADPLRAAIGHALFGGKRVRGSLLIAAASYPGPEHARAAACIEMLHAATLIQDDIFDQSRLRRGREALYCVFGCQHAILASDWMLAESIRAAYRLHPGFGEALSLCAQEMIAGEACEGMGCTGSNEAELRLHALAVATGKTGALFGLALSAPALLAGDTPLALLLRERGVALGVAFQYLDDALDLYGCESAAGKDVARDFAAQLCTLPMLDALALLDEPDAARLTTRRAGATTKDVFAGGENAAVRNHLQACAVRQWRSALIGLCEALPEPASMYALLQELTATMLSAGLLPPGPSGDPAGAEKKESSSSAAA